MYLNNNFPCNRKWHGLKMAPTPQEARMYVIFSKDQVTAYLFKLNGGRNIERSDDLRAGGGASRHFFDNNVFQTGKSPP